MILIVKLVIFVKNNKFDYFCFVKLQIPITDTTPKLRTAIQVKLIYALLNEKENKELQVLTYLVRHNTSGVFVIKRNYRADIARTIKSTSATVRDCLGSLSRKKLIRYVSNEQGNNLGCYVFHSHLESLCSRKDDLSFSFEL